MKVRYTLVKRQGDKTFQDSIKSLVLVMNENGVVLTPVKHLPRKLKKTLKRLGSWEFELEGHFIGDTNPQVISFGKGVISNIPMDYFGKGKVVNYE